MNKTRITLATGLLAALASTAALAADNVLHFPLQEVIDSPEGKAALDGSVKFYLDGASHGAVKKTIGNDVSNKKTNGVGKSDKVACDRAALSALIAFQAKAKTNGANAVVNLMSWYKKVEFKSATEYECHAGGVVVGVTLKGDYAEL